MSGPETAEQRRARKAAQREANAKRLEEELTRDYLRSLPESMSFLDMQAEHARLRQKIVEIQSLVLSGGLDLKVAQDMERRMVDQIHLVEERARSGGGGYVPRPGH